MRYAFTSEAEHRQIAISRDSEREALEDAANQRLQKATNEQAAQRNAELPCWPGRPRSAPPRSRRTSGSCR